MKVELVLAVRLREHESGEDVLAELQKTLAHSERFRQAELELWPGNFPPIAFMDSDQQKAGTS